MARGVVSLRRRGRALLFVSFHRARAAAARLTGGGDAAAERPARLRGAEGGRRGAAAARGARARAAQPRSGGHRADAAAAREAEEGTLTLFSELFEESD